MDPHYYIDRLEISAPLIVALIQDMSDAQLRWRPAPDSWSALEVLCHLYDEEREDFRVRLDLTLHRPDEPIPQIDTQDWVIARRYQSRDAGEVLEAWLTERRRSLEWLRALEAPDWERRCTHPYLTDLRAGDFLAAWAGHDLLHLRQLTELQWAYQSSQAAPYTPAYAGDW
ncbi:DinB family protein [Oscillochloris sp. ZM17-4]|uniref:DinB family protein n=1 Tax=Oscillochloris sp. ZM17-4 TaxID=2866714 RepID=UPI001C72E4F8|nr:DinB family protein [Oscillochloris sp. ZM17-4]